MFRSKPNVAFIIKKRQAIWGKLQNDAFTKIKQELISDRVLAHYNPELTTLVTADARGTGRGARAAAGGRLGARGGARDAVFV